MYYSTLYYSFPIGVKSERTIEAAQQQREQLKVSFKETRNHTEALQLKLNKHNDKLQDARATYNELHEEQLQIHSDMQKLKHLKDKQEDLYTREVNVGETVEKLQENLVDAEDQLNVGTRKLEKAKVCLFFFVYYFFQSRPIYF